MKRLLALALFVLSIPILADNVLLYSAPTGTGTTMPVRAASLVTSQTITQTLPANTQGFALSGFSLTGTNATKFWDWSGILNTSGGPSVFKWNFLDAASGNGSRWFEIDTDGTLNFDMRASGAEVDGPGRFNFYSPWDSRYDAHEYHNYTANFNAGDATARNFLGDAGSNATAGVFTAIVNNSGTHGPQARAVDITTLTGGKVATNMAINGHVNFGSYSATSVVSWSDYAPYSFSVDIVGFANSSAESAEILPIVRSKMADQQGFGGESMTTASPVGMYVSDPQLTGMGDNGGVIPDMFGFYDKTDGLSGVTRYHSAGFKKNVNMMQNQYVCSDSALTADCSAAPQFRMGYLSSGDHFDMDFDGTNAASLTPTGMTVTSKNVIVSPNSTTNGGVAWAAAGTSCATSCTAIHAAGCQDSASAAAAGTLLGNCTSTTALRICYCK